MDGECSYGSGGWLAIAKKSCSTYAPGTPTKAYPDNLLIFTELSIVILFIHFCDDNFNSKVLIRLNDC